MDIRDIVIALAGLSIGLGIGLGVYAIHRIGENREERWLAKSGKKYNRIMSDIAKEEGKVKARVEELHNLAEYYRVGA